jgi:hypothetical protein
MPRTAWGSRMGGGRSALCIALVVWAALSQPTVAADAESAPCLMTTTFEEIRDKFIDRQGRLAAAPVTTFLSGDSNARLVFQQALGENGNPKIFRVFETDNADIKSFKGTELPVLSVQPALDKLVDGYRPSDSVLLRVEIDAQPPSLWREHHFLILACSGARVSSWGLVTARVSSPFVSFLVCTVIALLIYLLAMSAVWVSRRSSHPLEAKYPAFFAAKKINLRDFINPIHLTANAFNQASVQKLQVLLFSFLVGWLLLSLVLRTGALADLSPTVVGLLGISGIGAATAQITYQQKTRLSFENWAWLDNKGVLEKPDPRTMLGPQWRDLVLTNREFDVYKLQTIIFSVAVAFALITAGASNLSSFTVPETLLGILGLSQVVYIGGILVRPPAVNDLDEALTKLRAAGETVAAAKAQNTDTGPDGKLLATLPPGQGVAVNAQRQYDDLADRVIPMIESTLEVKADRTKL